MQISYATGVVAQTSALGVMAPSNFATGLAGHPPRGDTSFYTSIVGGTSLAAPVVSGGAILFMNAMRSMGWTIYSRDLATNLLLMGDGYDGISTLRRTGVSPSYGMGRFRVLYPHSTILGAPFGWGYMGAFLAAGTHVRTVGSSGREAGVRQWRWVTAMLDTGFTNVQSDYVIRVVDACATGRPVVAADTSFDLRKRIQLFDSEICPTPTTCRCLEMEIVVLQAGSGGARIHSADFFHSGTERL